MQTEASNHRRGERGVLVLAFAFSLVAILGMAALVIDLGAALVTKVELQNASDAATLAGNRELALIYKELGSGIDYEKHVLTDEQKSRVFGKIKNFAERNYAAGKALQVRSEDVVYGRWNPSSNALVSNATGVRGVSVKLRRDSMANGPLPAILAPVLGVKSISVRARSATAITSLGGLAEGGGGIPVGISETWFTQHSCQVTPQITLYPTGTSCAGWHTFMETPASASRLGAILRGLKDNSYKSPMTTANTTIYNFTGGTLGSVFDDMVALFEAKKDADGGWDVVLPVYRGDNCGNPSGPILIVGFARARITSVTTTPSKTISGFVKCGVLDASAGGISGGSGAYGTLFGSPSVFF